jgi:hypothetical protein
MSLHTVAADRLHTFDLCAIAAYNGLAIRRLLQADVFGAGTNYQQGMFTFSRLFRSWRAGRRLSTWISAVRLKNLGSLSKPLLRFRLSGASKNRLLLPFVVRLVGLHRRKLRRKKLKGRKLFRCGLLMLKLKKLLMQPEVDASQEAILVRSMRRMLRTYKQSGGHVYPKHHLCLHLAEQARAAKLPDCM